MRTIIVPGLGGSDEHHWQSLWERESPDMLRIAPASWDEPTFIDWSAALDRVAGDERVVLVAHSLGCLLAVRWTGPTRVVSPACSSWRLLTPLHRFPRTPIVLRR